MSVMHLLRKLQVRKGNHFFSFLLRKHRHHPPTHFNSYYDQTKNKPINQPTKQLTSKQTDR